MRLVGNMAGMAKKMNAYNILVGKQGRKQLRRYRHRKIILKRIFEKNGVFWDVTPCGVSIVSG
jgi:hypothetical protein